MNKKVFEEERDMAKHATTAIQDMRRLGLMTSYSLPSATDVPDGQVRPDHPTLFASGPGGAVGAALVRGGSLARATPAGMAKKAALGTSYGLPGTVTKRE